MDSKVLVIDDDWLTREVVSSGLREEGFEVIEARDGRTAINLARNSVLDLILCDMEMPGLDGFETLKSIRKDPSTATTPFIFLTGKTVEEYKKHGMELGATDYLAKPFKIRELLDVVRARLARR